MDRTIQTKFMAKLAAEKEATLRLKGENGIMKKKFSRLSKWVPSCCTSSLLLLSCVSTVQVRQVCLATPPT